MDQEGGLACRPGEAGQPIDARRAEQHDAHPGDHEHHRRNDIDRLFHQHDDQRLFGQRRAGDAQQQRQDPRHRHQMEEQPEMGEEELETLRQHLGEADLHEPPRSAFSPALTSVVPSASASRWRALPGRSGLG